MEQERIETVSADATLVMYVALPEGMNIDVNRTAYSREPGDATHAIKVTVLGGTTDEVREKLVEARRLIVEALA